MENLNWGLGMTALGMGLVFTLLIVLWGLLTLVSAVEGASTPPVTASEAHAEAERIAATADAAIGAQAPEPSTVNGMPADLVAAITLATLKHRTLLRRQAAPMMRSYWPGSQLFASRWVAAGRTRQNTGWQRGK